MKRGHTRSLFLLLGTLSLAGPLAALARRWFDVVEVRGGSMRPTLVPGDRLLVERLSFERRAPRPDEVVLAPDPRDPSRELVKRVVTVVEGRVTIAGDTPERSTDSRTFGSVPIDSIRWRAIWRYWPRPRRVQVTSNRRSRRPRRRRPRAAPAAG